MLHRFLITLLLLSPLSAWPQAWPGSVVTNATIPLAVDHSVSALSSNILAADLAIPVTSEVTFAAYEVITIDSEQIQLCAVGTGILTVCPAGRGFFGTVAAAHNRGAVAYGYVEAGYFNSLFTELTAIETWLVGSTVYPGHPLTIGSAASGSRSLVFQANTGSALLPVTVGADAAGDLTVLPGANNATFQVLNPNGLAPVLTAGASGIVAATPFLPASVSVLPSATAATVVYCATCTVAACATPGTGAWAFYNPTSAAWSCPF